MRAKPRAPASLFINFLTYEKKIRYVTNFEAATGGVSWEDESGNEIIIKAVARAYGCCKGEMIKSCYQNTSGHYLQGATIPHLADNSKYTITILFLHTVIH